jgi:hypothetical protein
MSDSEHHGRRVGAILLGLLLIGASVLWSLFWLFGLAWVWRPEFAIAVFLSLTFAVGIVALLIGLFLVVGHFPARWGWLATGAVALVPLALLVPVGVSTSAHASDAEAAASRALADRTGATRVTADCSWESDDDNAELWRCALPSDVCFVLVADDGDGLAAVVDRCNGDDVVVEERVGREYRKLRGVRKSADSCWEQIWAPRGGPDVWRCDLSPAGSDGYCYANVAWGRGGRVKVAITSCERDVSAAIVRAYAKRSGHVARRARCVEDEQNRGQWTCDMRPAVEDRCIVAMSVPDGGRVAADISYCEREVAAGVNSAVARMYMKRTAFEKVKASCSLREPERWTCRLDLSGERDRCDVTIERRTSGPKVVFWATICASGRL